MFRKVDCISAFIIFDQSIWYALKLYFEVFLAVETLLFAYELSLIINLITILTIIIL